jgi:hypothetical protein
VKELLHLPFNIGAIRRSAKTSPISERDERMVPLSGGPAQEAWMDCQIEKLDEGSALDNEVGITRMVFAAGV